MKKAPHIGSDIAGHTPDWSLKPRKLTRGRSYFKNQPWNWS